MFQQLISIVFPIFGLVAVGYFYARKHAPDMASANKINLEIFTPALIFSVLSGEDFQLAVYTDLALAAAIVVLGSGLLTWPVARFMGWSTKAFVPPMMFTNSGNMGLPLALLAFGENALPAAMVLFLVENTLHFTVGNAMLEGRVHPLVLLRMPMLIATLLGLIVAVSGIGVWEPLAVSFDLLGKVAIPLMLFSLGVRMIDINLKDWRIGIVSAIVCPASGLLMALIAIALLGLEGVQWQQLLVFAVLPPAVLNYMLADRFDIEPDTVATIVLVGNLASIVTIPLILLYVL